GLDKPGPEQCCLSGGAPFFRTTYYLPRFSAPSGRPELSSLSTPVSLSTHPPLASNGSVFLSGDNAMNLKLRHLRLEKPLGVLDLETTGLDPQADRIVELAIVKLAVDGEPI